MTELLLQPGITDSVRVLPSLAADTPGDRYGIQLLTATWLAECRSNETRRAYFRDLGKYLTWCQQDGLNPLEALPADVARFKALLPGAATSVSRTLSVLSSWYKMLAANRKVDANPLGAVKRPRVDRDASTTVGLSVAEVKAMSRAAEDAVQTANSETQKTHALRDRAVLRCLADLGMRREEVVSLDLDSLTANRGYRTLRYVAKGGKTRERVVPAQLGYALDTYIEVRGSEPGPLFATEATTGGLGRLHVNKVFLLVKRLAREAGIAHWARISPHSMRHAFATNARELGIALEDVQDALGHADPRTTRRYDRARHALKNDPGLRLGALYEED